jgi:hypothetical protein
MNKSNHTLSIVANESRGLPKQFIKAKPSMLVFVHAYPNLDRVLMGQDLICRAFLQASHKNGAIALKANGLKVGMHVFLGLPGLRGVAKAYVEIIKNGIAYVSGMGTELEGAE